MNPMECLSRRWRWRAVVALAVLCPDGAVLAQSRRFLPPVDTAGSATAPKSPGKSYEELTGEEKERFDHYMRRLNELFAQSNARQGPIRPVDAAALVDLLYEDMVAPHLNGRWQDEVVDQIRFAAMHVDADPESMEVLRSGLLEYAGLGGGRGSPYDMLGLAWALAEVSCPERPECEQVARRLCDEATAWAHGELAGTFYERVLDKMLADVEWSLEQRRVMSRATAMLPPQPSQAWDDAWRALRELTQRRPHPRKVRDAAAAVLKDFGDDLVNDDMLARLLIAYRLLLKERRIDKDVVAAIDGRLHWLAKSSGRLRTERHWELWARAAGALGRRASPELRRYIHETKKATDDPIIRAALERAERGLRRPLRGDGAAAATAAGPGQSGRAAAGDSVEGQGVASEAPERQSAAGDSVESTGREEDGSTGTPDEDRP